MTSKDVWPLAQAALLVPLRHAGAALRVLIPAVIVATLASVLVGGILYLAVLVQLGGLLSAVQGQPSAEQAPWLGVLVPAIGLAIAAAVKLWFAAGMAACWSRFLLHGVRPGWFDALRPDRAMRRTWYAMLRLGVAYLLANAVIGTVVMNWPGLGPAGASVLTAAISYLAVVLALPFVLVVALVANGERAGLGDALRLAGGNWWWIDAAAVIAMVTVVLVDRLVFALVDGARPMVGLGLDRLLTSTGLGIVLADIAATCILLLAALVLTGVAVRAVQMLAPDRPS